MVKSEGYWSGQLKLPLSTSRSDDASWFRFAGLKIRRACGEWRVAEFHANHLASLFPAIAETYAESNRANAAISGGESGHDARSARAHSDPRAANAGTTERSRLPTNDAATTAELCAVLIAPVPSSFPKTAFQNKSADNYENRAFLDAKLLLFLNLWNPVRTVLNYLHATEYYESFLHTSWRPPR